MKENKSLEDITNGKFLSSDWGMIVIVVIILIISWLLKELLPEYIISLAFVVMLVIWKLPKIGSGIKTYFIKGYEFLKKLFKKEE